MYIGRLLRVWLSKCGTPMGLRNSVLYFCTVTRSSLHPYATHRRTDTDPSPPSRVAWTCLGANRLGSCLQTRIRQSVTRNSVLNSLDGSFSKKPSSRLFDPCTPSNVHGYVYHQLRMFKRSTSTIFRSLETISNCLDGESSVGILLVPKCGRTLTSLSRFRSSPTCVVLGLRTLDGP